MPSAGTSSPADRTSEFRKRKNTNTPRPCAGIILRKNLVDFIIDDNNLYGEGVRAVARRRACRDLAVPSPRFRWALTTGAEDHKTHPAHMEALLRVEERRPAEQWLAAGT
jgi:hypothetical protein